MAADDALLSLTNDWMVKAGGHRYSYHFSWLGRPIIQYPQDIVAMQELIWKVKPDLIIETGNRAWRFIDTQRFHAGPT